MLEEVYFEKFIILPARLVSACINVSAVHIKTILVRWSLIKVKKKLAACYFIIYSTTLHCWTRFSAGGYAVNVPEGCHFTELMLQKSKWGVISLAPHISDAFQIYVCALLPEQLLTLQQEYDWGWRKIYFRDKQYKIDTETLNQVRG